MEFQKHKDKKYMSAEEAAIILSETLEEIAKRRTTVRRAMAVSRLALALSKIIDNIDLRKRVEFLEQSLKRRR